MMIDPKLLEASAPLLQGWYDEWSGRADDDGVDYDEYNSGCRRSEQGFKCDICQHKQCGWCPDCSDAPDA